MNVTIAGTTSHQHEYDQRGDVLSLGGGALRAAARTAATPAGHGFDYADADAVTGTVASTRGACSNVMAR